MRQRVKLIAEWIFDQLIYPWIAGTVHNADVRWDARQEKKRSK